MRISVRDAGPLVIGLVVTLYAALWLVARPDGEPMATHVGQLIGVESIVLLSLALILVSMLPWVEEWFDGIDRAAVWHRRIAIAGLVLVLPHLLLASNGRSNPWGPPLAVAGFVGMIVLVLWAVLPRWRAMVPPALHGTVVGLRDAPVLRDVRRIFGGYERWRALHRTTGLFVAAGFVHGLLDATAFDSGLLRWTYVGIGGLGLAFYAYRELLARHFAALNDYEVDAVRTVADGLVEIALRPLGRTMEFVPGQFAMVFLEAKDGWHRHPFTIASAPTEPVVRFTVKALGDYTSHLHEDLEPGMPAVIGGPHGRFDRRRGTDHQIWIGAGVGVAPFLSWARSLDETGLRERVDFFYTAEGDAPFGDELAAIAHRHPSLRLHLVDTGRDGRLTVQRVLETAAAPPADLSVFMCGPARMLREFQSGLRHAGVPARAIHREFFNWR